MYGMVNKDTDDSYKLNDNELFDDEKVLIKEIQQGNAKAFKALMREYFRELADFARYYTPSSHMAKDIVQDVFANIWEKRNSWNPTRSLRMYLYQAVKNEALKMARDKKTERKYLEAFSREKGDRVVTPKESDESEEFRQAVHHAIQGLPDRARMVYKLHRRDGLTYKEIAKVMDISHKTVESQMSRALRILRARLSSYLPALIVAFLFEWIFY